MIDPLPYAPPTRPRACNAANRADKPVPVAERSRRPGEMTTAFRIVSPAPEKGSAISTIDTPEIPGL